MKQKSIYKKPEIQEIGTITSVTKGIKGGGGEAETGAQGSH